MSFVMKVYVLGAIASMGLIVIGVSILISGTVGISSILTLGLGVIYVALGAYVFIKGSAEEIPEF